MTQQAKLYLAQERGLTQTDRFRSYYTFNTGSFFNEHKTPAAQLYVCNDDTLAGGHSLSFTAEQPALLLLIPVAGAVTFSTNNREGITVTAGEVYSTFLQKGTCFKLTNPFEEELVNFLQYWLQVPPSAAAPAEQLVSFNIQFSNNALIPVPVGIPMNIAKMDGRRELVYRPAAANNCFFAFIIQGAFEIEGVLLQPRDGAAFWNYRQAEIEALSNDAIIVLIEMKSD